MFKLCSVIGVTGAALISVAAYAGVNIEYGQEYEEAYLESCAHDSSMRACVCSMEALQEKVGFERFAEEIDRHRRDFRDQSELGPLATDLVAKCEATARVHGD
jgi:hypothetical protein